MRPYASRWAFPHAPPVGLCMLGAALIGLSAPGVLRALAASRAAFDPPTGLAAQSTTAPAATTAPVQVQPAATSLPARAPATSASARPSDGCLAAGCHENLVKATVAHGPVLAGLCDACHESEQPDHKFPLKRPGRETCTFCHSMSVGNTPHEPMRGDCLRCHQPHAAEHDYLLKSDTEGLCGECHPEILRTWLPTGRRHPKTAVNGEGCGNCHDPHGPVGTGSFLLRSDPIEGPQHSCLACHPEKDQVRLTGHAPESLSLRGFKTAACHPCHWTHIELGIQEEPQAGWWGAMAVGALPRFDTATPDQVKDPCCTPCHSEGGRAPEPVIATHPDVLMFNPYKADDPDYLPLFDDRGQQDEHGKLACRTCHLAHGRDLSPPSPWRARSIRMALAGSAESRAVAQSLRHRQMHLRAFTGVNVCTTCHGLDARRRFLYFHEPARRGGPLGNPAQPPRR